MSLQVTTREVKFVSIVDAIGRITQGEGASCFRDSIRDLTSQGRTRLLLNLSDVSYMDSSGLGELTSALSHTQNHGGTLKLLSPTQRVAKDLQTSGMWAWFEVFDDEAEAVKSFSQPLPPVCQQPISWP